ncbi:MAG: MoaD/ThiS family protein [Flavobacteriales bacterium]
MKIRLLSFGLIRDITGAREIEMELRGPATVGQLRTQFPRVFSGWPESITYAIAVNQGYAEDTVQLEDGDEVALIPPVSGG